MKKWNRMVAVTGIMFCLLVGANTIAHGDDAIDSILQDFDQERNEARQELLDEFDRVTEKLSRDRRANGSEKLEAINALKEEKERFREHGYIPFSPWMRKAAFDYLKDINESRSSAATACDRRIGQVLRESDIAAANELISEKDVRLAPKIVGIWDAPGPASKQWRFYDNGGLNIKEDLPKYATGAPSWAITPQTIEVVHPSSRAPKGKWIDSLTISNDGKSYAGRSKEGAKFAGKIILPSS